MKKRKNKNKSKIKSNEKDFLTLDEVEMLDEVEEELEEMKEDLYQDDQDNPMNFNNTEIKTEVLKTAVDLLATPTVCSMLLDKNFLILYIRRCSKPSF